jgi:hypothetical protein
VARTRPLLSLAVLATVLAATAGCSTSQESSTSAAGLAAPAQAPDAAADGSGGGGSAAGSTTAGSTAAGKDTTGNGSGSAAAPAVRQRVIRTAQVVVEVDGELAPAAARVRAAAEGIGGTVSSETTTYADAPIPLASQAPDTSPTEGDATSTAGPQKSAPTAHAGQSVLVLRVPEASLDRALSLITGQGGVGRELSRSATAEDVTGDLADLGSRVATQRASVDRIRALLAKATSLQQVVLLESEVTKRESDLEALQARQAALADRADLATLTVDLRTTAAVAKVEPAKEKNAFLQGLDSGWRALVASLTVVLTVVGALLPLAVVVALVGGPVLWFLRRRRRPARAVPAASPISPSAGAGS